jgi:hypothetical protein
MLDVGFWMLVKDRRLLVRNQHPTSMPRQLLALFPGTRTDETMLTLGRAYPGVKLLEAQITKGNFQTLNVMREGLANLIVQIRQARLQPRRAISGFDKSKPGLEDQLRYSFLERTDGCQAIECDRMQGLHFKVRQADRLLQCRLGENLGMSIRLEAMHLGNCPEE